MDQRLRAVDLTLFEYGALMSLLDSPKHTLRISEMAERTYAPLPRMSKVVVRLESRGLVRRVRSIADSRAFDIELTTAGRSRLRDSAPIQSAAARELALRCLSADEVTTLGTLLSRLVRSLDPNGPLGTERQAEGGRDMESAEES
ncbi:MarR family transcriptional regulator [Rhodococcus sp. G-MC3]|uniref:MarR family winged helix-turn-helix transcriptional regulator n=1 Tax=Rhodococcus sp. G-MC3 TaxID=3046209 RepID=UPI0024BA5F8C|nr:MarR family transcriptional regulator [Rhodococcus sp. G-MC3]MDJ0396254.1 MarR family transcriptional regulator [Rhodococcus sp. G-MC3]